MAGFGAIALSVVWPGRREKPNGKFEKNPLRICHNNGPKPSNKWVVMVKLNLRKVTEADPVRDWVPAEFYDIVVGDEVVGTIQLRLGNTDYMRHYGGHVGYGVEPQHRGHGYASAALLALRPLARQHGFEEIWITCRPDNVASCRTLERVGASYEGTVDVPLDSDLYARGDRQMRRYRLIVQPAKSPPLG